MLNYNYGSILRVSLPLMLSGFVQSIVLIINAAFLSRYNQTDFDAVGNASLVIMTMSMILLGISEGGQILMGHNISMKDKMKTIFFSSLTLNSLVGILMFSILTLAIPSLLILNSSNEQLLKSELSFIEIRSYSFLFVFLSFTIQSYFYSLGKVNIVVISTIAIALSNVCLDYLLIFGNHGFPKLGILGAGLASNIAEIIGMLILLVYLAFTKRRSVNETDWFKVFSLSEIRQILKTGLPIAFQGMLSILAWTIFFFWIEARGEFELTVSQNIRSIYFIAFVPIWGFAITTKIYVSQFVGLDKTSSIKLVIKRIQVLSLIVLFVLFHGAIFYPEVLVRWVNPSINHIEQSADILFVVAVSILLHSFLNVYLQSIIGFGKTRIAFLIEVFSTFVHLVYSYIALNVFRLDLNYVWLVELLYFLGLGTMSYLYIKQKKLYI